MILLEQMDIYQLSMQMGDKIYDRVMSWDTFGKDTIGKQVVRSADSVAANFAEGYGRFFFKERRRFCYYSRGSLMETKTWMIKAKNRGLIPEENYKNFYQLYLVLLRKLNAYIKNLNDQIKKGKE